MFLAAVDTSSAAYRAGQDAAPLILCGWLLFISLSFVLAAIRKSRGWLIAAVIAGALLMMLVVASFGIRAYLVMQKSKAQKAQISTGPATQSPVVSAMPVPPKPQLVTGTEPGYAIEFPAGWAVQRKQNAFDSIGNRETMAVGVISSKQKEASPDMLAKAVRTQMISSAAQLHCNEVSDFSLDGRRWLQFSATSAGQGPPTAFVVYIYSGPEGSFRVIGFLPKDIYASNAGELVKVMQTFKFPR